MCVCVCAVSSILFLSVTLYSYIPWDYEHGKHFRIGRKRIHKFVLQWQMLKQQYYMNTEMLRLSSSKLEVYFSFFVYFFWFVFVHFSVVQCKRWFIGINMSRLLAIIMVKVIYTSISVHWSLIYLNKLNATTETYSYTIPIHIRIKWKIHEFQWNFYEYFTRLPVSVFQQI